MDVKRCQSSPSFSANIRKFNMEPICKQFGASVATSVSDALVGLSKIGDDTVTFAPVIGFNPHSLMNLSLRCEKKLIPAVEESGSWLSKLVGKAKSFFGTKTVSSEMVMLTGVPPARGWAIESKQIVKHGDVALKNCMNSSEVRNFEAVQGYKKAAKEAAALRKIVEAEQKKIVGA